MKRRYSYPFRRGTPVDIRPAPFHKTKGGNMEHCVDFALPEGTPVCAARNGRVTGLASRFSKNYGNKKMAERCNYIVLLHDDGEESVYVHLAKGSARVKVGQKVRRGQVIAESGQTGYATYPHLHFGVYDDAGDSKKVKFARPSR